MNALPAPPQPSSVAKPTSPALSPRLRSALETPDVDRCIGVMAADPQLVAEAAAALPVLRQAALAPAGDEGVKRVVGRRLATFPAMEMSEGEWAAWWGDYVGALGDLSEAALELGMRAYIREPKAEFMPKPWPAAGAGAGLPPPPPRRCTPGRKMAVEAVQRLAAPPRQRPDPAAVAEMMGSFRSRMTRSKPADGERSARTAAGVRRVSVRVASPPSYAPSGASADGPVRPPADPRRPCARRRPGLARPWAQGTAATTTA